MADVAASAAPERSSERLSATENGVAVTDTDGTNDGRIRIANPAAAGLFGVPAESLVGRTLGELLLAVDGPGVLAGERLGLRADGSRVPLQLSEAPIQLNGTPSRVLALQDLSERKARDAQIDQLLTRLQLACDVAEIGIWDWDLHSNRLAWDARMCDWYAVPEAVRAQGLFYELWRSRVHPEDLARIEATLGASRAQIDQPFKGTFRILLPDGRLRHIEGACVCLSDGAGKPARMLGINRDMSEAWMRERERADALQRAEAGSRAKSSFLANISHEVRTPLNSILGMCGVLLEEITDPHQRQQLVHIRSAGSLLLQLLNDVLDHAKIEAGQLRIEAVPFRLAELFEHCRAMFAAQAGHKRLDFDWQLPAALPPVVVGDPLRLQQVLNNLIGNALKFTERGSIRVELQLLGQEAGQAWIKVLVHDTGIGLAPGQLARLFTAFQQADESTTRQYGGTGLGLAICKRLVELMGGEIGVTSAAGMGSTFWFTLPLGLAGADARPVSLPAPAGVPPGPPAQAASGPDPDPAEALPLLRELAQLLAGGQARARQCSRRLETLFAGTSAAHDYETLARDIAAFRFAAALQQLQAFAEQRHWDLS